MVWVVVLKVEAVRSNVLVYDVVNVVLVVVPIGDSVVVITGVLLVGVLSVGVPSMVVPDCAALKPDSKLFADSVVL